MDYEKIKTVEIFSGTKSFSKVASKRGCETFTIDFNEELNPDLIGNILDEEIQLQAWSKVKEADVVWMSPVCTSFSLASGNKHWYADRSPKSVSALKGKSMLNFCKDVADYCIENNKIFFIENPMARMRWFMRNYRLTHVWYCQYGDTRAKPTDIWNNLYAWQGKKCKNVSNDCHHERAPRGSKTGTQGLKGNKERSIIPSKLFDEIFDIIEKG